MKKVILTLGLLTVFSTNAFAAGFYTVEPPSAGIFGTPTSVTTTVVGDNVNKAELDISKNSALIPPAFGSHTSNLRGSGEPLTPNLASPYTDAVTGQTIIGNISTQPSVSVSTNTNQSTGTSQLPSNQVFTYDDGSIYIPGVIDTRKDEDDDDYDYYGDYFFDLDDYEYNSRYFTKVTSSMYYTGGYLATLKIPSLDVSVKVYEGTTNSVLAKGAGHFENTSIWNGNVCIAAHNRGTNAYFGRIHTLDDGDRIQLTTKKGTRTYRVFNVEKISVNDTSNLQGTNENIITLITCVRNQANYRWCVQAEAI